MTSIDKMQLRGIRSFSPNVAQDIEFFKPLTLIVGKNGSGKTTIIEALKMSCTGDLPPNCRNGQSWIHDPKILAQSEVKGQVKLRFTSVAGKPVVCTRSFSLTQKATKLEYKAFEAALQTVDANGQKQALSYKCADLNKLVPELMGVSTAVLESVIFVHQEDACWPLSDDATLKKKFDDIFAATQYTKALEEIRKYKNTKKTEEKSLGLELATLEEQLGTANRLRGELATCEDTAKNLADFIAEQQEKIDAAQAKLPQLQENKGAAGRIRAEIGEVQIKMSQSKEMLTQRMKALQDVYKSELTDSDDLLKAQMAKVETYMYQIKNKTTELENDIAQLEANKHRDQQNMYDAKSRLEAAKAQRNQHQAAEREAENLLAGLGAKYDLTGAIGRNAADTTQKAGAALDAIKGALHARTEELNVAKAAAQEKVGGLLSKKEEKRVKVDGTGAEIHKKQQEAKELQKRESELNERIQDMQADEVRLQRLKDELRKARTEAETQTEEAASSGDAEELRKSKARLSTMQHQFTSFMEEMGRVDQEQEKQSRAAQQRKALEEAQGKLERAIDEKRSKIRHVLGGDADVMQLLEDNQLVKKVVEMKRTRETEKESMALTVRDAEKKASKLESDIYAETSKKSRMRQDQEEAEERIRRVDPTWLVDGFDFQARAAEAEREAEQARELAQSDNKTVVNFLDKVIEFAHRKSKCSVCNQACSEEQRSHMKRKRDQLDQTSQSPQDGAERARQHDELARKLHRAEEESKKVKKLKTIELPAVEQTIAGLRTQQSGARDEVDSAKRDLEQHEALEKEAQELSTDANMLRFMYTEYERLKGEVQASAATQSAFGASERSKADVTNDINQLTSERETIQRKVDKLEHALRQRENDMQRTQREKQAKEVELSKLQAELERQTDLQAQVKEIGEKRKKLLDEATVARQQEQPLRAELRQLEEQLQQVKEQTDREVTLIDGRVSEANRDFATLTISHEGLKKYALAGHEVTLAEAEKQFQSAEQAVRENDEQVRQRRQQLDHHRNSNQQKEAIKLEIQANLEYRNMSKQVGDYKAAIQEKEQRLAAVPNHESIDREMQEINKEISKARLEVAQANGSLDTVRGRLEATKKDLRDPKYRKVDDEHRKKLIECKTVQLAVKDLDAYYKALDRALMKYHSSKMESINKSIKELWNKTYKGPDIDGIEIHSEHEGETAAGARKQSYRVVMSKGDTKLDMRGRCSAGQKVLASLIIRLALAESFCVNCGILALDEPTTNLDTANIESFASALNEIIKARRQQANFQLIVITHDEDFVQMVGRSENASHYFRVDKRLSDEAHHNSAPHSVIDRFEIGRFG